MVRTAESRRHQGGGGLVIDASLGLVRIVAWAQLPTPVTEHRFHPVRRWRFDLAWPDVKLAVEVEGGTWTGGHHSYGKGFESDCEKYNEATLRGWRVLRVTPGMIDDGRALETIERALR